ncbi:MAG TPA: hypothetical protein VGF98_02985 [Candidatus Tumulicola sp.]|jgi:hypothetical protein
MNVLNCFARQIVLFVGIAALAGCAGSRAANDVPSAIPQTLDEAKRSALLYISDQDTGTVFMYSYPSLKPAGLLTGINNPTGMCVDPKTGNVWITESSPYAAGAVEFAHGATKPIRTLQIGEDNIADACAVNPTKGELAVANITFGGDDPGDVILFNLRTGKSKTYYEKGLYYVEFLGYDDRGNLFVDGTPTYYQSLFRFDELPNGANKLVNIRWRGPQIAYAGNVQYDGSNIAVGDGHNALIYQTAGGRVLGTTALGGACSVDQYYIDGDKVIAPSNCSSVATVSVYNYPAGGAPIATLTGFSTAFGAVISR